MILVENSIWNKKPEVIFIPGYVYVSVKFLQCFGTITLPLAGEFLTPVGEASVPQYQECLLSLKESQHPLYFKLFCCLVLFENNTYKIELYKNTL